MSKIIRVIEVTVPGLDGHDNQFMAIADESLEGAKEAIDYALKKHAEWLVDEGLFSSVSEAEVLARNYSVIKKYHHLTKQPNLNFIVRFFMNAARTNDTKAELVLGRYEVEGKAPQPMVYMECKEGITHLPFRFSTTYKRYVVDTLAWKPAIYLKDVMDFVPWGHLMDDDPFFIPEYRGVVLTTKNFNEVIGNFIKELDGLTKTYDICAPQKDMKKYMCAQEIIFRPLDSKDYYRFDTETFGTKSIKF